MPALVAGIHVFSARRQDVDGRACPGHDEHEQLEKALRGHRNFNVTFPLTIVSDTVTV
jgi:hypothetical protein